MAFMGFGRRQNNRDNGYQKKRKLKTQIRLIGVLVVVIGFLVALSDLNNHNNQNMVISLGFIIAGMAMIFQRKLLIGLKNTWSNATTPHCNCCKCTNCGSNHNHWTHD